MRGQVLYAKKATSCRSTDDRAGARRRPARRRRHDVPRPPPYDALAEEKEKAEREHAEELERLAEEHASELTALRQGHVTELEELREQHAEELAANEERYAALGEREKDRYEALAARHDQLLTCSGGPCGPAGRTAPRAVALAADDAGQLWPEGQPVAPPPVGRLRRITTLIDTSSATSGSTPGASRSSVRR
ncbi:hypothetical protein GCM10023238_39240 [Streptomyces heliomycini]